MLFPNFGWNPAGGPLGFSALALNFHLENQIGGLPVVDFCVGHQGDETVLQGLKSALDLAFGLRRRCHEVRDVGCPQGALKLAARIGVRVAGTRPEEAQGVGIDRLGQTVTFEGLAERLEVVPGGISLDETARDKQARTVIDSEQQCLLVRCRPPLVDRAVVLPEFADVGAAEAPIGALLWGERGNPVGEVGFDVGFESCAGSLEVAQPLHFVSDELIVGRALNWQEALEKFEDRRRPLRVNMKLKRLTGERPSTVLAWHRVAEGNCVAERRGGEWRGGEQPKANLSSQSSQTRRLNPIRPIGVASLRRKGEALALSLPEAITKHDHTIAKDSEGVWDEKAGKAEQLSVEILLGATESGEEVRALIVALKRVTTVEPRGVGR